MAGAGRSTPHRNPLRSISFRGYTYEQRDIPDVAVKETLSVGEQCTILRRRAGLTVAELAEKMNVDRYTVSMMERGHRVSDRLVAYWKKRLSKRKKAS